MPFFDIFASPRWSPVVSIFIFFHQLSNKNKLRLHEQRCQISLKRGGGGGGGPAWRPRIHCVLNMLVLERQGKAVSYWPSLRFRLHQFTFLWVRLRFVAIPDVNVNLLFVCCIICGRAFIPLCFVMCYSRFAAQAIATSIERTTLNLWAK